MDGGYVGWGPTITEINFLAQYWDEVVHIGCLLDSKPPRSSLPYKLKNIRFVSIPPFGGPNWNDKLGILFKMPNIFFKINKELQGASEVQLRLPTGIGVFLLPWFSFRSKSYVFWVKYAGNWSEDRPPIGYSLQRWWLKNNFAQCKVTINGCWPNQPKHCLSFENPCLYEEDLEAGKAIASARIFNPPYTLIFIGRLEDAKGVSRILDTLEGMSIGLVKEMHFVGDCEKKQVYWDRSKRVPIPIFFHGFLGRSEVHELLKAAHFLLLPSTASEGFPKVIAEAACFGVLPIVSEVSSVPHYINPSNGYLWRLDTSFSELLRDVLQSDPEGLKKQSISLRKLAPKFSFNSYMKRLRGDILRHEIE
jgi:glycosyltransferase involved in cell wall biosynthesis